MRSVLSDRTRCVRARPACCPADVAQTICSSIVADAASRCKLASGQSDRRSLNLSEIVLATRRSASAARRTRSHRRSRRRPTLRHRPPRSRPRSEAEERAGVAPIHPPPRLHRPARPAGPERRTRQRVAQTHRRRARGTRPAGCRCQAGARRPNLPKPARRSAAQATTARS